METFQELRSRLEEAKTTRSTFQFPKRKTKSRDEIIRKQLGQKPRSDNDTPIFKKKLKEDDVEESIVKDIKKTIKYSFSKKKRPSFKNIKKIKEDKTFTTRNIGQVDDVLVNYEHDLDGNEITMSEKDYKDFIKELKKKNIKL